MHPLRIGRLAFQWPRAERKTLEIATLSLAAGESLFLYGPSGSGKSTLLSAIAGVVDVPKGVVRVAEKDVGALRGGARDRFRVDHIGMIFQVFNLVPWLSALENVLLPCTFSHRRRTRTGDDPAGTTRSLLDELGLSDPSLASKQAHELSVGQQQRVAAARALIGKPDLILADEPTSALDDAAKAAFVELLARECAEAGAALLFVSHDRGLERHFDRAVDFQDLNRERRLMLGFSLRSLWNRRFVAGLTVLAIGLSVALILGVERLRDGARDSFANSASGIDLIVAPRGNPVQILMATVFGVGGAGTGMTWESFEWLEDRPEVAWAVPIQMGDNHRGYPVIGTDGAYFEHFRHSGGQLLSLEAGAFFPDDEPDAAVVGAEVAARLGYAPGAVIVNAHGSGDVSFDLHDNAPFTISGVLAPTGTAVDRMVFVTLEGFDTLHAQEDAPLADPLDPAAMSADAHGEDDAHGNPEDHAGHDDHEDGDDHESHDVHDAHGDHEGMEAGHGHEPDRINAVYVGLIDRTNVLGLQRAVNERPSDALSAVLPAVALAELWGITGTAERAMRLMAWAVALAGMIGMVVMLSATLDTRRREFAILRSVGATPTRIFALIVTEAAVLTAAGLILGLVLLTVATFVTDPILSARFGLRLGLNVFGARGLATLFVIFCAGLIASLIPAIRVYRMTLADGLSVRL